METSCGDVVNRVKLNVDASVVAGGDGGGSYAIGMIIRDHEGGFIQAKSMRFPRMVPVLEAEAHGVLEATRWIQLLQLQDVDIETDSQLTVNALQRGVEYNLEVGDIFDECQEFLCNRPDVAVYFVKRQANKCAHLIARVPYLTW